MKKGSLVGIYLKQMRIKSWLKNLFVFCAIIFSLELFEWEKLLQAILLALAFCLTSSGIYILNDIKDVKSDRNHAVKKSRPIAAGLIPIPNAWILLICLLIAGSGLALFVNRASFLLILLYIMINVLYTKWLKNKVVIDCFCIAAGFVIRVMVGGTIVSSGISDWMFLTVVSLSLFMAFGKRRGELSNYKEGETREVLEVYEANFLNGSIFLCAGLTMAFYSLWSISQKSDLVYTVPIVLFIIMRYLLQVFKGHAEADPTDLLLSDKILLLAGGFCIFIVIALLYGPQIF